ncbi:hypothetical protein [Pseudoalteromonas gelatinilytica]
MSNKEVNTTKNKSPSNTTHASNAGVRVTTINRNNMVVRGNKIRVKRGRYSGATAQITDPTVIEQIYEVGKIAVPLLITYGFTKVASNASRGTNKRCRKKSAISGKVCKKPMYYRETQKDSNGQSFEVFTCDLGHVFRQRTS